MKDENGLPMTGKEIKREIISWILVVVVAFVLAYILTHYVIIKAKVPTGSMLNTIQRDDKLVGLRTAYLFSEPKRGDIIIFPYPDNESEEYIKRVIGLPGETIIIHNVKDEASEDEYYAAVFLDLNKNGKADDDERLEEGYVREKMWMVSTDMIYKVPENSYFVMGDNRNDSKDSRYWYKTHFVSGDKIIAKAWFRYSPSIGFYNSVTYNIGD